MSGFAAARSAAYDAAARQQQRQLFMGMNAYDRHKKMVHDLVAYYGGSLPDQGPAGPQKTDFDILRDNFRFIRSEEDDGQDTWEVRLARRYYSKLFKEYAIADLSRHQEGKVGLRWRTQREVVNGVGQFICGAKGCSERRGLASFEVPFAYEEAGERKQALVKVRLCPTHAYQLNYRKNKEAERAQERRQRKQERKEQARRQRKEQRSSGGKAARDGSRSKRRYTGEESRGRRGSSSGSASSDEESSSSSSDDEDKQPRHRSSKRRRSSNAESGGEPAAVAPPAHRDKAAATAGKGPPAANDFEAFLQGLFE